MEINLNEAYEFCDICFNDISNESAKKIYKCLTCSLKFHKKCLLINTDIKNNLFKCHKCYNTIAKCNLCNFSKGILTIYNNKYYHISCIQMYILIGNPLEVDPINGKLEFCYICFNTDNYYKISCSDKCHNFHLRCLSIAKLVDLDYNLRKYDCLLNSIQNFTCTNKKKLTYLNYFKINTIINNNIKDNNSIDNSIIDLNSNIRDNEFEINLLSSNNNVLLRKIEDYNINVLDNSIEVLDNFKQNLNSDIIYNYQYLGISEQEFQKFKSEIESLLL